MKRVRAIPVRTRAALGILALLAGAGSATPSRAARPSIAVSRADTLAGVSFEILGRVLASTRNLQSTETNEQFVDRSGDNLVGKARALGASAVLGLHGLPADPDSHPQWVSGVAVRVPESGATAPVRAPFILAVPTIDIPDSVAQKPRERAKLALALQDQACSMMEKRGYYARASGAAPADTVSLAALSDSAWSANFGAWTENVLVLSLEQSSSSSQVIYSRRDVTMAAWMYSRTAGRVVWRSEAAGGAGNWKGFNPQIPILAQGIASKEEVREKALANAVAKVLDDAPRIAP